MNISPTQRFTSRVDNYRKYRPGYPPEIIPYLVENAGLTPQSVIADIGAGTGLLTQLFLEHGNPVYAVEPNQAMRAVADELLNGYAHYHSVDASAENTSLPDHSVDMITAAQAFHWFDHQATQLEFQRVLKPGGMVVLIWNTRDTASPIVAAYNEVVQTFSPEYKRVVHTNQASLDIIADFFAPHSIQTHTLSYSQSFDYPALRGRLLSSSYALPEEHQDHPAMLAALKQAFDQYQQDGLVEFKYKSELFWGDLQTNN